MTLGIYILDSMVGWLVVVHPCQFWVCHTCSVRLVHPVVLAMGLYMYAIQSLTCNYYRYAASQLPYVYLITRNAVYEC